MANARMAPACASRAGTESTAPWKAARMTAPNTASANLHTHHRRLKLLGEAAGAAVATKDGMVRTVLSRSKWSAMTAKTTIATD